MGSCFGFFCSLLFFGLVCGLLICIVYGFEYPFLIQILADKKKGACKIQFSLLMMNIKFRVK